MTVGLGLVLLLVGAVSFISYQNATQITDSAQRIRQTNRILKTLTQINATLTDAESRRRGYTLFQDPEELERHRLAIASLQSQMASLREILTGVPRQQQRLHRLESLTAESLQLFQQSINLAQRTLKKSPAQDPITLKINQNQQEIQQQLDRLQADEETVLETQIEQSQTDLQLRMLIELLGTLLTFAVLLGIYTLFFRQLIKRQQAEAQQQKLLQEKELTDLKLQFFSMVSHEFRTPLSLIMGSSQLLEESLKSILETAKLKNLYRIQSAAKSMSQLLNDILTLSRAEAGKLDYHPQPLELQMFCLNLIEDLKLSSGLNRSIKFLKHGHSTYANVDEKLLYTILSNLLSNAIKYSSPDSIIEFTLVCDPEVVTFCIKDEGIGIPPEDLPILYTPFLRSQNAKSMMGSGLGLTVVKKCLDLHQGQIFVESKLGKGSTFTIKIPQTNTQDKAPKLF